MGRPMVREDFEAAASALYRFASKAVADGMRITPLMFIVRLDDDHHLTTLIPVDCAFMFQEHMGVPGRRMASEILRRLSTTPETDMAALVTDAFAIEVSAEELRRGPHGDLAEDPRRQECILVILRTPEFSTMANFPIDREARTLTFEPVKWGGDLSGAFAHKHVGQTLN